MRKLLSLTLLFCSLNGWCQKLTYIPQYILDTNTIDGKQFSWDKTAQSENFTLIWGNTVGTDPANYPDPNLAFDPATILDTMEMFYAIFKQWKFVDDAPGTHLAIYKIPIIMYNTWGDGAQGYANGGSIDGIIGAFWVHPIAMHTGDVAAHEFTHSLQAQTDIDYRQSHGLGNVWQNSGIFWETHANFMRNLLYPKDVTAWGMDVFHIETLGDWKNTYENYEFLLAIMESDGIDMVNRLWRESYSWEYPLQAYKRLSGFNQDEFNDKMFEYARRMPTFDFNYNNIGSYFRQYRANDLNNWLPSVQACYTILKQVDGSTTRFEVPIEIAPEEYAYNIIPLYPDPDSCAVIIKFKGHTNLNAHAGWRYGFVAEFPDGLVSRYSKIYAEETDEINFTIEPNEAKLYLVVMGAPIDSIQTNTTNDTWKGYPKHFRYPYELNITGAKPEGFQSPSLFRNQLKTNGHLHSNGGGWVQNSASVASSVYVGPTALVLGNAVLTDNVRVEKTAIVRDGQLSGNTIVSDNALITGGSYADHVRIRGQAFAENVTMSDSALLHMRARVSNYHLSGNIEVGGDVLVYNVDGDCDNGVYYRMTNYYDDNLLECDGRTAQHPANLDVNASYDVFTEAQMKGNCNCLTLPDCFAVGTKDGHISNEEIKLYPNPLNQQLTIQLEVENDGIIQVTDVYGKIIAQQPLMSKMNTLNTTKWSSGIYFIVMEINGKRYVKKVMKM